MIAPLGHEFIIIVNIIIIIIKRRERKRAYGWWSMLGLALGLGRPVAVVDGGVLEQSGEYEDETHDEIDVDCFDVRDARQRRPDTGTDGGHRQHRRYTCISNRIRGLSSHPIGEEYFPPEKFYFP